MCVGEISRTPLERAGRACHSALQEGRSGQPRPSRSVQCEKAHWPWTGALELELGLLKAEGPHRPSKAGHLGRAALGRATRDTQGGPVLSPLTRAGWRGAALEGGLPGAPLPQRIPHGGLPGPGHPLFPEDPPGTCTRHRPVKTSRDNESVFRSLAVLPVLGTLGAGRTGGHTAQVTRRTIGHR